MPHKDDDARRAYYREWKKSERKKLSDKYYSAARNANRRAARLGAPGTLTTADVRDALDGQPCEYCGSTDRITVDHREPLAAGGSNTRGNIVPACRPCNARKHLADQPGRWSAKHEVCTSCGLTDKPHASRGLCQRCHNREYHLSRKPRSSSK